MYGEKGSPALRTLVREPGPGEEPTHWAWWDSEKAEFPGCFVWPSESQVEVCFTYGTAAEMARGRGEKMRVVVDVLGPGDAP